MTDLPSRRVPRPHPHPQRTDIAFARPRHVTSVAIAFADARGPVFRYHATSGADSWSGEVDADTAEAAVLNVIGRVLSAEPTMERIRFLVNLPAANPLWQHAPEVGALLPGISIEMPDHSDRVLMNAACTALTADAHPSAIPVTASVTDLAPVWVATDGSVRGRFTGYGWLASTGEYGLCGFRHSTKQIGTQVVLIAELRALGAAVRKLRSRRLTLLCDSTDAIAMARRWMAGHPDLPDGYTTGRADGQLAGLVAAQRLIQAQRSRLTPVWVRGHHGEPLNEGADALARLARRYAASAADLSPAEYQRRAASLAEAFAAEFRRRHAEGGPIHR